MKNEWTLEDIIRQIRTATDALCCNATRSLAGAIEDYAELPKGEEKALFNKMKKLVAKLEKLSGAISDTASKIECGI